MLMVRLRFMMSPAYVVCEPTFLETASRHPRLDSFRYHLVTAVDGARKAGNQARPQRGRAWPGIV